MEGILSAPSRGCGIQFVYPRAGLAGYRPTRAGCLLNNSVSGRFQRSKSLIPRRASKSKWSISTSAVRLVTEFRGELQIGKVGLAALTKFPEACR
jgi:hypothetical protein